MLFVKIACELVKLFKIAINVEIRYQVIVKLTRTQTTRNEKDTTLAMLRLQGQITDIQV